MSQQGINIVLAGVVVVTVGVLRSLARCCPMMQPNPTQGKRLIRIRRGLFPDPNGECPEPGNYELGLLMQLAAVVSLRLSFHRPVYLEHVFRNWSVDGRDDTSFLGDRTGQQG